MNYYSTIHALELIYFDSNTQETMKKQFILQILLTFRHCTEESRQSLTLTQAFPCISYVYSAQKRRYTV